MVMTMAFNYGGRAEIVDAVRALVAEGIPANKVDEKAIRRHLYFPDMPDPDLVIRTSGETRISNFLLWEIAYSELVFPDILWPDMRRRHLYEAVVEYQRRVRRFGAVNPEGHRTPGPAGPGGRPGTGRTAARMGGTMTGTRIALIAGIVLLAALRRRRPRSPRAPALVVVALVAVAALIGAGNLLYGTPLARRRGPGPRPAGPGGPRPGRRPGRRGPPGRGRGRPAGRALLPPRSRRRHQQPPRRDPA